MEVMPRAATEGHRWTANTYDHIFALGARPGDTYGQEGCPDHGQIGGATGDEQRKPPAFHGPSRARKIDAMKTTTVG